ncbi:MAG: hypothetical protein FJ026_05680, partial [Chloroflexi bacterium]|nr:hypothetical protein [Chloroflexota bacterium]
MEKEYPRLLDFLSDRLDYRIQSGKSVLGYDLYFLDLSSWRLRLSELTPVVHVKRADLAECSPKQILQSIDDVIRERGWQRRIVLVLLDGNSQPLIEHGRSPLQTMAIIGAEEQERILRSRRPSGELLDLVSAQIPISILAPYNTTSPVTGSCFFDREYEIAKIISSPDVSYAILGIRRIGKTSLLREVERRLRESSGSAEGDDPVVSGANGSAPILFLDCSDLLESDALVEEVVRKLNPRELPRLHMQNYAFYFPHFLERMKRKYGTKLILLLDEIDDLIVLHGGDWSLFRTLRAAANKGVCQYVVAGFREAQKQLHNLDSPFYNFADEIRLNEFTRQHARELIVTPMQNLGIRFKNESEIVGRIFEETAGHPNLIQFYCTILVRQLEISGLRELSPQHLTSVYGDDVFRNHLLRSFIDNTQNLEKAIVYAILQNVQNPLAGFSQVKM